MEISLYSVGCLKSGPERTLVDLYLERCRQLGRGLGFTKFNDYEIETRHYVSQRQQGEKLLSLVSKTAFVMVLDERGKDLSSSGFSDLIDTLRVQGGMPEIAFLIGGADGHIAAVRNRADKLLSLGRQTWPHKMVRIMLAEQIYRACSILKATPYHRG